jgi:hypothetical protein
MTLSRFWEGKTDGGSLSLGKETARNWFGRGEGVQITMVWLQVQKERGDQRFSRPFRTEKWRENLPALISGPNPGARGAGPVQVGYCKSIFCLNAHKAKPWLKGAPGLAKRTGMAAPGPG